MSGGDNANRRPSNSRGNWPTRSDFASASRARRSQSINTISSSSRAMKMAPPSPPNANTGTSLSFARVHLNGLAARRSCPIEQCHERCHILRNLFGTSESPKGVKMATQSSENSAKHSSRNWPIVFIRIVSILATCIATRCKRHIVEDDPSKIYLILHQALSRIPQFTHRM